MSPILQVFRGFPYTPHPVASPLTFRPSSSSLSPSLLPSHRSLCSPRLSPWSCFFCLKHLPSLCLAAPKHPSDLGSNVTSSRKPCMVPPSLSLQEVCPPVVLGSVVVVCVGGGGEASGEGATATLAPRPLRVRAMLTARWPCLPTSWHLTPGGWRQPVGSRWVFHNEFPESHPDSGLGIAGCRPRGET